jgi:LPS export ABC transporter protein LptC
MIRKLNIRNLLALVILVLAGALTITVVRNFQGALPEEDLEALPRHIDLSLQEIRYTETSDGLRRWTLVADTAAHSVSEGVSRIENIQMTFYDAQGAEDVTLAARSGSFKVDSREVEVHGDVVVKSSQGFALYTEQLIYRETDRMIRTDAPVRMVSDRMALTGNGMLLSVVDHNLVLLSAVRARIEATAGNGKKG